MTCQESAACLHEFFDQELPEHRHAAVRAHLESCPACWRKFEFERRLRTAIWEKSRGERVPAYLLERIRRNVVASGEKRGRPMRALQNVKIPAWGLGMALFFLLALGGVWMGLRGKGDASPLIAELVGDHIKYAVVEKPSEMVSSNAEEIENWLESGLGYGIAVPRFEGPRIHLVGGRLLHLRGERVAYLIYVDGEHVLSLYVAKVADADLCTHDRLQPRDCRLCLANIQNCEFCLCRHRDYNVLSWQEEGVTYAMVSDLDSEHMLDVTCPQNRPG